MRSSPLTCASKSYSATTYFIDGGALGFGFTGGGGAGRRVAGVNETDGVVVGEVVYGGGGAAYEFNGGGAA